MTLTIAGRGAALTLLLLTGIFMSECGNDRSISDCSRRDRPQHRDNDGNWTCR